MKKVTLKFKEYMWRCIHD